MGGKMVASTVVHCFFKNIYIFFLMGGGKCLSLPLCFTEVVYGCGVFGLLSCWVW